VITYNATGGSAGHSFSEDVSVPDEAYGSNWEDSLEVPTKNAVYDKIQTLGYAIQLANDQATAANTTPVNLTSMVFNFEANSTYIIDLIAGVSSTAATTGYAFMFNLDVAVTAIWMTGFSQLANTGTVSGFSSIADDTAVGVTSGTPTGGTIVPVMGKAVLKTSANAGTAQLRFRSETTAVTTCKAGTTIFITKVL
jgi:hypothetical protein